MTAIALSALLIGIVAGFTLARRFMLRTLVALICALIAVLFFVALTPVQSLPGNGFGIAVVAYLIAPPMAAGLFGGGVIAWIMRPRNKAT